MSDKLFAAIYFLVAADYIAVKSATQGAGYPHLASTYQEQIALEVERKMISARTFEVALRYYSADNRKHLLSRDVMEELQEGVGDYRIA